MCIRDSGSFENDDAMDWVNDCVQAASAGVVKAALDRVLDADVVEVPDASAAIAAAEVVAASLGKPSPAIPANLKAWLAAQPRAQIAAQAALAERVLTKDRGPSAFRASTVVVWGKDQPMAHQGSGASVAHWREIGGTGQKRTIVSDGFRVR